MIEDLIIATKDALALNGAGDPELAALPMAGSDRYYWRVKLPDGGRCVLSRHQGKRPENERFAPLARFLAAQGVRVPAIFSEDAGRRLLWQEDLGDTSLESLASSGDRPATAAAYRAAMAELARLHAIPESSVDAIRADLQAPFDAALYRWEQGYFCDHFVARHSGLSADAADGVRGHPALAALAEDLAARPRTLVHRDCQSQNILWLPERRAALIDFQGLRPGLPEYDLASLLYDPYVALPPELQEELFLHYHDLRGTDAAASRPVLLACAMQRLMQALGAYANLADNAGKSWYHVFIPVAARRLNELANHHPVGAALCSATARF